MNYKIYQSKNAKEQNTGEDLLEKMFEGSVFFLILIRSLLIFMFFGILLFLAVLSPQIIGYEMNKDSINKNLVIEANGEKYPDFTKEQNYTEHHLNLDEVPLDGE